MSEFICLIIGLAIGGLCGVTTICCLQIDRLNKVVKKKEDENEKEKY